MTHFGHSLQAIFTVNYVAIFSPPGNRWWLATIVVIEAVEADASVTADPITSQF